MAKTAHADAVLNPWKTTEKTQPNQDAESGDSWDHMEARMLRGTFARSVCAANAMAELEERAACDDGVPCPRLSACLEQADSIIRYLGKGKKILLEG